MLSKVIAQKNIIRILEPFFIYECTLPIYS